MEAREDEEEEDNGPAPRLRATSGWQPSLGPAAAAVRARGAAALLRAALQRYVARAVVAGARVAVEQRAREEEAAKVRKELEAKAEDWKKRYDEVVAKFSAQDVNELRKLREASAQ